jgi:hypothetical protein
MSGRSGQRASDDPCKTIWHVAVDMAGTYEQLRRSARRELLTMANLALLQDACDRAEVTSCVFDAQVPGSPAGWQPETCAGVTGRATRTRVTWRESAGAAAPPPDPKLLQARHVICLVRFCQRQECRPERRRYS